MMDDYDDDQSDLIENFEKHIYKQITNRYDDKDILEIIDEEKIQMDVINFDSDEYYEERKIENDKFLKEEEKLMKKYQEYETKHMKQIKQDEFDHFQYKQDLFAQNRIYGYKKKKRTNNTSVTTNKTFNSPQLKPPQPTRKLTGGVSSSHKQERDRKSINMGAPVMNKSANMYGSRNSVNSQLPPTGLNANKRPSVELNNNDPRHTQQFLNKHTTRQKENITTTSYKNGVNSSINKNKLPQLKNKLGSMPEIKHKDFM